MGALLVIGLSKRKLSMPSFFYLLCLWKLSHVTRTYANELNRLPEVWYKPEGRELTDRIWEETVEEFNFVGLSSILEGLKNSR